MGILQRIFGKSETRAMPPIDPCWSNFAATRGIGAASPDAVLSNLSVATRCITLRSELLASVPLFLSRKTPDGGRALADDNPLFDVLHDIANPGQSAFEFRELMVRCLDLYGNAFAKSSATLVDRLQHYGRCCRATCKSTSCRIDGCAIVSTMGAILKLYWSKKFCTLEMRAAMASSDCRPFKLRAARFRWH